MSTINRVGMHVSFVLALSFLPVGATGGDVGGDRYVDLYRDAVTARMAAWGETKHRPYEPIATAHAAWVVAEKTGDARIRDFALRQYDAFLEGEGGRGDRDFHVSRPFGLMTLRLDGAGELTGVRRQRARDRAVPLVKWYAGSHPLAAANFDCNIALADAVAADCLTRVFTADPDLPADRVREMITALGRQIRDIGDLNENSSNYSSLGICFFLELADLEGWLGDIARSADFRNMFTRMRDIISPAGTIPEYGDGYFAAREPRIDFVLLLEMASRLYGDASFRKAAEPLVPRTAAELTGDQLPRAYLLMDLGPFTAENAETPPLSAVHQRRAPGIPTTIVLDKLILRTGTGAGDAMVMVDLYARGSHAHPYKRPAIGYYEVAGVPLFHNLGRRGTSSGQCGNSFWMLEDSSLFPGHPRPGVWNTMSVPATMLAPGAIPGTRILSKGLDFRGFRTPANRYARFDNLRIEGPKGTLLLDGFESPDSWQSNITGVPGIRLDTSTDHTEGAASQQVNWKVLGDQIYTRLFEESAISGSTFSVADYDTLKFDYKYEGQPPRANLRQLFPEWLDLGERPLTCDVVSAEAVQAGRDAWGRIEFDNYIATGCRLTRTIVLIAEGGLVVVDRVEPGPRVGGWSAGQLWQLYELAERGPDWFAAKSDGPYRLADGSTVERRMLVKFHAGSGAVVGSEEVEPPTMHAPRADGSRRSTYLTTFSKKPVRGRPIEAALAVLPIDPGETPSRVADGVRFVAEGIPDDGMRVSLPVPKGVVVVEIEAAKVFIHRAEGGHRTGVPTAP